MCASDVWFGIFGSLRDTFGEMLEGGVHDDSRYCKPDGRSLFFKRYHSSDVGICVVVSLPWLKIASLSPSLADEQ